MIMQNMLILINREIFRAHIKNYQINTDLYVIGKNKTFEADICLFLNLYSIFL